ncbi:hypothetical protein KSB_42480 [Ktedonobacter robiniae]|uniref:Peptidase S1 domain-containing protein n=1 Tax=Ktedonobacter robiniae TaxID=2778365 RepID=A0ABQ3UST5_9CHLR|nr:hypothetical protein KSB_42480 [Ktedonobacter robiniae]
MELTLSSPLWQDRMTLSSRCLELIMDPINLVLCTKASLLSGNNTGKVFKIMGWGQVEDSAATHQGGLAGFVPGAHIDGISLLEPLGSFSILS